MARPTLPTVGATGWGPTLIGAINDVSDRADAAAAAAAAAGTGESGTNAARYRSWKTDFVTAGFNVHRTGSGDHPFMITASNDAIEAAIATGQNFCDLDARYSENGDPAKGPRLYMVHNDELSEYSDDISGSIKQTPTSLVEAARMSGPKVCGGTYSDVPFTELGAMVQRYGGQMLFEIELKNQTSSADWAKSVALFKKTMLELGNGAINNVVVTMGFPNAIDPAHVAVMDANPEVLWGTYASSSDVGYNVQSNYDYLKAHNCMLVGASLASSASLIAYLKTRPALATVAAAVAAVPR